MRLRGRTRGRAATRGACARGGEAMMVRMPNSLGRKTMPPYIRVSCASGGPDGERRRADFWNGLWGWAEILWIF